MSKEKLPVNWSEVCNQLKIDERLPFDLSMLPLVERNYMVAAYKLPYIVRAINGDWNSDYTNENQYKYFPYFIVKTDGNVSGSGRSCHVYGHWRAAAFVGVRLCFENKEKVEHCVKYFLPEYEAFLTYKNENIFDFENVEVKEVGNDKYEGKAVNVKHLTFGEQLVGLTFNPSNDSKVDKAKRLCADLADLVNQSFYEGEQDDKPLSLRHKLFNHTIGEILNAQMNVVKVLTFKY